MIMWAEVKYCFEGVHNWPDAPAAVIFLRHPHRHMFHVTVWVEQFHDQRDVEYLLLRRYVELEIQQGRQGWDVSVSCEWIAKWVYDKVKVHTSTPTESRRVKVRVSEDDENGALVED